MPRRDPGADAINRYWNAVNRGAPPEELVRLAETLDPALIETIDRARALRGRRRPSPAFANRLERDLMQTLTEGWSPLGHPSTVVPNGWTTRPGASTRRSAAGGMRGSRPRLAPSVGLVLLLLALAGGWVLLDAPRPLTDQEPRGAIPAPLATPEATPDPATVVGVLIDTVLIDQPETAPYVDIERLDFDAGVGSSWNHSTTSNFVAMVTEGQLRFTISGGQARVVRGLGGAASTVADGAPQVLDAGDAIAWGPGTVFEIAHEGDVPAVLISFNILSPAITNPQMLNLDLVQVADGDATFAPGPLHLVARRIVLDPGATYAAPAGDPFTIAGPEDPSSSFPMNIGGDGSQVTNTDTSPQSVLVMTLEPTAVTATLIASPTS